MPKRRTDFLFVALPYGEDTHRSVYLSLFGSDLQADLDCSAGVRLVIGRDLSDERAMELYRVRLNK
jgi:hypothetical protein